MNNNKKKYGTRERNVGNGKIGWKSCVANIKTNL